MSDFLAQRIALLAGEAFAASTLLMLLAWLAGFARRASLRHLAWAAAFAALIALPVLAALVPGSIVFTVPAPEPTISDAGPMDVAAAPDPAPVWAMTEQPSAAAPEAYAFRVGLADAADALLALWFAGIAVIALRHLLAGLLLRALYRDSLEHPFEASELPPMARHCDLRLARGARGPVTWGVWRPVVLLPNQAQFWPCDRLQAALRHEFAHVRRRDGLAQALALIGCALYWPNPLVWLGARALRREAEIAADDAVIASGMTPSDYAGELLHMAREFRAQGLAQRLALSMAAPSALPARVKSILAPTQQRSGVTSMDVLKMAAVALLTTSALVAARPSLAQDMPPAPPSAAEVPAPPAPPADVPPPPPPAEADAPVPPVPPAAAAPPDGAESVDRVVRVVRSHNGHVTRTVRIELKDVDAKTRDAMARVQPELARAMAEVKTHEAELRRIQAMRPRIDAQVRQALAEARAQIALIDDAKIRAKVDQALARAQHRIDQAYREHGDVRGRIVIDDDNDTMDDGAPDGATE